MNFKVKDIDISSGGVMVAVINQEDALKLTLHHGDRVGIINGKKHAHAIIDIAENVKTVPLGQVGLFEEVLTFLNVRHGSKVKLVLEEKPMSVHYIKEKLIGKRLNSHKINEIIKDIVAGKLSNIELTYFVAGSFSRKLNSKETVALTKAMINTGEKLKVKSKIIVDKHCTGGVAGNRTTMIVVPIICAAGLKMPKTSSRAITSPAGTADTMEVLANVTLSKTKMEKIVNKLNGCIMWGGAMNLAPADDKIIKVERPLRIDAEGQMLASVLAKKGSVGATHVLIDIPVGIETKIHNKRKAKRLGKRFVTIGKKLGMNIKYMTSNGNEPIGNGIGPALEAKDVLKVLQRSDTRPLDLEKKSVIIAGKMLELSGKCQKGKGELLAQSILDSGKAMSKMKEIIKAQGGKIINASDIKVGKETFDLIAKKSGKVKDINNHVISNVARFAGAPADKKAGLYLYVHEGDMVVKGQKILTIHADSKEKLRFAKKVLSLNKGVRIK